MSTKHNSSSFQNPSTCSDGRGSEETCNPFSLSKGRSDYSPSSVESLYFTPNSSRAASAALTQRPLSEDDYAKIKMRFHDGGQSCDLYNGIPSSKLTPFSAGHRYKEENTQSDSFPMFNNAQQDMNPSQYRLLIERAFDEGKFKEYKPSLPSNAFNCQSVGNQLKTIEPNQDTSSAGYKLTEEQKKRDRLLTEKVELIHRNAKGGDFVISPSIHSVSSVNPKTTAKNFLPTFLRGKKTPSKDGRHNTSKDSGNSSPRPGLFSEYAIPYTHGLSSTLMSLT